jgi:hypothetical protein
VCVYLVTTSQDLNQYIFASCDENVTIKSRNFLHLCKFLNRSHAPLRALLAGSKQTMQKAAQLMTLISNINITTGPSLGRLHGRTSMD